MPKDESKTVLLHYSEIALKKGNRALFEKCLRDNIKRAFGDVDSVRVRIDYGRFVISLPEGVPDEMIVSRLKDVVGIANFGLAYNGDKDVDVLKAQILSKIEQQSFDTFRIMTKRSDKHYPLTSVEVNQIVGGHVHQALGKSVDLKNADLTCTIEIFNKRVLYYVSKHNGIGGLPVGSVGKVVSLLSSGIDSPVASYRMMTRGCRIIFVHFHSFPFTDKSSYHNSAELVKILTRFQYSARLYMVPLADMQQMIIENVPAKYRLLLYRRMMLRMAEIIAKKEKARALVTGESLGQVASQTLENISAISSAISIPVLRPLIGRDKESIIHEAKQIGTFETSIQPYEDSCGYMVPKNPETRARLTDLENAEQNLDGWQNLMREILDRSDMLALRASFSPE